MKTTLITFLTITISTIAIAQTPNNVLKTYVDFKSNQPSEYVEYQLKKRTGGNVFMTGGINNYRLKKINPASKSEEMTKEVCGVLVDDSVYINSYPYSHVLGYNQIVGEGHYSYFIGEPARIKSKQVDLGIVKVDEPQKAVCCKASYVILPSGEVKWLTPELLGELIADYKELNAELKNDKLLQENAYKMFDYLNRYNEIKE